MTVYRGYRHSGGVGHQLVTKDDDLLSPVPSQNLWNHSPDGFNWGYGGSGPAQLALALLYDATEDGDVAVRYHQQFKWHYISGWGNEWQITTEEILAWLKGEGYYD